MFTKNNFIKSLAWVLCMLVCIPGSQIFAGTTGKISGKIIDKSTGEALIGANVLIMGSSVGSSSDIDGNYFILNIPPGEYQVKASMVGYSSVTFEHVRVSVDQTTKIDFELNPESIELENVVVTAEKPIVRKDLTSTEQNVSGEDISMLPLEDVASVVNLQAGVINGHFRGGRSDEVRYLIDGVPVNDAYSGQSSLSPEVNSIQEVQVLVGTFNAEYGDAQSGVVNQVTKIAGEKITGNISAYTGDYVSSHKGIFQNINHISPNDVYDVEGNLSGPVPAIGNLLKFFISGRYNRDQGYIYGQRIFNPQDSSNFSANNPADWYVGATGDKAYVPMNYSHRLSLQGKLAVNVGGGRGIVLTGLYQDNQYKDYNHLYRLNPDGDYTKFQKSMLGIASYTLLLGNSAFVDFSASGLRAEYKQYVYANPLDTQYVNPDRKKDVSGSAFYTGGTENWHFNHTTTSLTGKVDFSWQIDNINQIKTGVEFTRHDPEVPGLSDNH